MGACRQGGTIDAVVWTRRARQTLHIGFASLSVRGIQNRHPPRANRTAIGRQTIAIGLGSRDVEASTSCVGSRSLPACRNLSGLSCAQRPRGSLRSTIVEMDIAVKLMARRTESWEEMSEDATNQRFTNYAITPRRRCNGQELSGVWEHDLAESLAAFSS